MKKSFMKTLFSRLVYKNKDAIYDLEAKKTAAEEQVAELSAEKAKAEAAAKELNIALKKSNADLKAAKASADGLAERLREREDEFLLSGRASAKIVSNYGERRLEAFDPASNQWKNEEVDYDNVLADTIAANFAPDEFMEVPHGAYVKLSSYTISKNRQAVLFAGKMPENHGNYKFECAEDEEAPQIVSTDRGHGFVRINASTGYPDHFHTINIFDGKRFFIVDESNQTKLNIVYDVIERLTGQQIYSYDSNVKLNSYNFIDPALHDQLANVCGPKKVSVTELIGKTVIETSQAR